jgi:HD-like signal output (HDOD) protein
MDADRRSNVVKLVEKRFEIPTIPAIATKVAQEIRDPQTSALRLGRLIANDQGLTTRILSVANSPFYGIGRESSSVQQAVVTLGFQVVQSLVVCFSTRKVYQSFGGIEKSLWEHSMGAALAADKIAGMKKLRFRREAFVAGLMHDVGKVVLNNDDPKTFAKAYQLASEGTESVDAEHSLFSVSHTDVGMVLTQRWGLSDALVQAVFLHHDLDLAETTAEKYIELIYVTYLADRICHKLGIGVPQANDILLEDDPALARLGFEPDELQELEESTLKAYEEERALFA